MHRTDCPHIPLPIGWGNDGLTEHIELAYRNQHATFAEKKKDIKRIVALDACYHRIVTGWTNPKGLVEASLMIRSHAALRAACCVGFSGQVPETFPLLRVCLEHAAYAVHMARNKGLDEIWLKRHNDQTSMQLMKRRFKMKQIMAALKAVDQHNAKVFEELYQRCIDFGGHPNERSLSSNLSIVRNEDGMQFNHAYLQGDGRSLGFALRSIGQVCVCSLICFERVFEERFEILGVRNELLTLRSWL